MKNLERAVRVYCALAESPVKVDSSSIRSWTHVERALAHSPNLLMEMRGLPREVRGRVLAYVGEFSPLVESRPIFQLPDDSAAKHFVQEVESLGGQATHLDNGGLVSATAHDFKAIESAATRHGGVPYKGPKLADAFESVDTTLPEAMLIKTGVNNALCEKALVASIYASGGPAGSLTESTLFAGIKIDGALDRFQNRLSGFCRPKPVLGVARRIAEAVRISGLATPEMVRLMEAGGGGSSPNVAPGNTGVSPNNDNRGGLVKDQPGAGSPANSRSGPQKPQTPPTEHVPSQEQGAANNAVRLPDGTEVPMDVLRQAFGKMLHNMATQVEQGTVGGQPTPRGADQIDATGAQPPKPSVEQQQVAVQSASQQAAGNGAEPHQPPAIAIYNGHPPTAPGGPQTPPVPGQAPAPGQPPAAPGAVPGATPPPGAPPVPHPAAPGAPAAAAPPHPGAPASAPGTAPPAPAAPGAPPHPGAPAAPGQPPTAAPPAAPAGDVEATLAKAEAGDAEALKTAQGMQGQMDEPQKARLQALIGKPAKGSTPPPPPKKESQDAVRRSLRLDSPSEREILAGMAFIRENRLHDQPGKLVERVTDKLRVLTMHESSAVKKAALAILENDKPATQDPAWEPTIRAMKKHKEIDNPYALANSMKNKGDEPHQGKGCSMGGYGRVREGVGFAVWEPLEAQRAGVLPEGLNYGAGEVSPGTEVAIIERGKDTSVIRLPNGDVVRARTENIEETVGAGFLGDQLVKIHDLDGMLETFRGSGVSQAAVVMGAPTSGRGYLIRTKIAPWVKRVQERIASAPFPSLASVTGEAGHRSAILEMRTVTAREDHATLALAKNEHEFDKMLVTDPRFRHVVEGRGSMLRDSIDWKTFQACRASFDRFFGATSVRKYYDGMGERRDRIAEAVVERMVRERRVPAFVQIGKVLVVDATPRTNIIEFAACAKKHGINVALVEMRLDLETVLRRGQAAKLRESRLIQNYNAVRKAMDEARKSPHFSRIVTYSWRGGDSVFEGRFVGEADDGTVPGKNDTMAVTTKKNIDGENGDMPKKSLAVTEGLVAVAEGDPYAPKLSNPHDAGLVPAKVKGIGMLLASLGFEAASKDVTADNYMRYAQRILGTLKGRINLTNPETRAKFVDTQAQAVYDKTKRAFKAMGLSEGVLGEALDVGQASEAESCASGMKDAGEQLKTAREAVFKLTTSTLVQCASMAQATGAKRTQKELAKAQQLAATFLDDLQNLAAQVDRANEVMKGENGGMGGDNLDAMKQMATAGGAAPAPAAPAPHVPPAAPPVAPHAAPVTIHATPPAKIESVNQAIAALMSTDIPERIARGEDYRSLNESISSRCPLLGVRDRTEIIERLKALNDVPLNPTVRVQFSPSDHRALTEAAQHGSVVSALVERTRGGATTLASEAELRGAVAVLRKKGRAGHLMLADMLEAHILEQGVAGGSKT